MAKKKDHSSKSHPSLERAPGKADNWVEKAGGLPPYIERIAKHLHSDKGMTISHAIATAVNTVKRWCQGGTVSKTSGPEKSQGVTPQTKAKACAAVAQWNAKKAKAGVNAGMDRDAYSDEDFVLELSQEIEDSTAWSLHLSAEEDADIEEIIEEDPETYELTEEEANEFDMDAYEQHLAQKQQGDGLDLAIFKWDPAKHPRNLLGQFREVLKTMDNGDAMELPDGTTIQKNGIGKYRRFNVHGGKSGEIKQNLRLEQVEEEVDLERHGSGESVGDEEAGSSPDWVENLKEEDGSSPAEILESNYRDMVDGGWATDAEDFYNQQLETEGETVFSALYWPNDDFPEFTEEGIVYGGEIWPKDQVINRLRGSGPDQEADDGGDASGSGYTADELYDLLEARGTSGLWVSDDGMHWASGNRDVPDWWAADYNPETGKWDYRWESYPDEDPTQMPTMYTASGDSPDMDAVFEEGGIDWKPDPKAAYINEEPEWEWPDDEGNGSEVDRYIDKWNMRDSTDLDASRAEVETVESVEQVQGIMEQMEPGSMVFMRINVGDGQVEDSGYIVRYEEGDWAVYDEDGFPVMQRPGTDTDFYEMAKTWWSGE